MKLVDKILPFETCKRLVDAGIMLDTQWSWMLFKGPFPPAIRSYSDIREKGHIAAVIPAPDMHELWEALPSQLDSATHLLLTAEGAIYHDRSLDCVVPDPDNLDWPTGETLADMASLLLWVKENHPEALEGK